jgi:hypothetical protein
VPRLVAGSDIVHELCPLAQVQNEVKHVVDDLGRNKILLQSGRAEFGKEITSRRAELDQLEREAIEALMEEKLSHCYYP